jgi:type VI secretion system secreted protein VgrG
MPTHADRAIHLKSPLADDVLLPRQVTGNERFSAPFRYDLQLLSEQGNVNPDELLGKTVSVSYNLPTGGGTRYFRPSCARGSGC